MYEFPPGFRMLAGDASRHTFDETDPRQAAVSYVCLGNGGPQTNSKSSAFIFTTGANTRKSFRRRTVRRASVLRSTSHTAGEIAPSAWRCTR